MSRIPIDIRKLLILSGKFSCCPETFLTLWENSILSNIFQDVWKLFRPSKNFPVYKDPFQNVLKLSKLNRNFPEIADLEETFQTVQKIFQND